MSFRNQDHLKIEKIQYKSLKNVYNSHESYDELLLRKNEVSLHQKQLRILGTDVNKSLADINPDFMKSYFTIKPNTVLLTKLNFV